MPAAPLAAPAGFEDRLKAMLQQSGHDALLSARVNFIGLQKIKERFGPEWERIAGRAERIARNIIERHLLAGDIYTGINGLTFVMVFARLSQEQAKVKCLAIADEIAKALLGERGGDLLQVKTAVKRIDGTLDLQDVSLTDQPCASLAGAEELAFVETAAPEHAAPASPLIVPLAARRPAPSHRVDPLANLRFLYRPIWDRARNLVTAYLCSAQVLSADGTTVLGDAEALIEGDVEERARLDERMRDHVLRDLAALMREGRQLVLGLPVHFETLSAAGRRRDYQAALGRGVSGGAQKFLTLEIAGVPAGAAQSRLLEISVALRGQCRGILFISRGSARSGR